MQLLEHFTDLTLHPKNAKELKGLILQLAIQGKLTANWRKDNPDVEPASELLKKIRTERDRLVKEKKIRTESAKKVFLKDKIDFDIPKTWLAKNITEFYYTIGSKSNQIQSRNYNEIGKYPIVSQGKNIIDAYSDDDSKLLKIEKPVVVFGDHTRLVKYVDFNFIIGADGTKILNPFDGVDSNYFFLHICSYDLFSKGYARHYNLLKLEAFALPPLEEQQEIVRVVEILFKEVEQLEQLTKERIALKEDYVTSALRQLTTADTATEWQYLQSHFKSFFTEKSAVKKLREAVLQLAVQGKLTVDWRKNNPDAEPATELLKRIQKEKAQLIKDKKIKKESPLPPIKDDEAPYELPESWVWCRMGDLTRLMAYGTSQKTNDNSNQIPVLRMGNLTSEGKLHFNNLKYIAAEHKDLPKLYLNFGDLVFNRTNSYELVGKSAVYKGQENEYTLASYLIKVSLFKEEIDSDYVNNYIISSTCRKTQIEPEITAQTNQANFSGSKLRNILVPLPNIKEQKAIVEKVNALMLLCEQLEQEIEESKNLNEQLMKSVLREVFHEDKVY